MVDNYLRNVSPFCSPTKALLQLQLINHKTPSFFLVEAKLVCLKYVYIVVDYVVVPYLGAPKYQKSWWGQAYVVGVIPPHI